jgi:metallophosphoesterase (TIGR00282 family)
LRAAEQIDFVVANGENAAGGTGLTPENFRELTRRGVDCITLGDHIYRRREIVKILESEPNIVKPANYPRTAPGRDWTVVKATSGTPVAVISLLGRVFMRPVDCPWEAVDRVLAEIPSDVRLIVVDFHAEATSDMQLMGRHLDGRVTSVLGTHTHVPTADEQILPGGTAFQCDIGMTGPYDSILGRRVDRVLATTRTFLPSHFDVAAGDVRLMATLVEADPASGRATAVRRVCVREEE